jgi:hypothetical protein
VSTSRHRCAECGAALSNGVTCLDCFHQLLAFENENPRAFGAVHHLTVASFYLQHPRGYTAEALAMWKSLLADAISQGTKPVEFLRRARERFEGATRARDPQAVAPTGWPTEWPMSVGDVIQPGDAPAVDDYISRAMEWARHASEALSAKAPSLRSG